MKHGKETPITVPDESCHAQSHVSDGNYHSESKPSFLVYPVVQAEFHMCAFDNACFRSFRSDDGGSSSEIIGVLGGLDSEW